MRRNIALITKGWIPLICIIAANFTMGLNKTICQTERYNQRYYEDCAWYYEQEQVYCSQDWMLFAYWPLECYEACVGTEICLGLFPGASLDMEYTLPENAYCCRFIVSGQYGWLISAQGSVDYTGANGVTVDFNWEHSSYFGGPYTLITNSSLGFGPNTYMLDDNFGNGLGGHYFRICATKVYIPANMNGNSQFTTIISLIYEV